MRMTLTKTIASAVVAGAIAVTSCVTPASAFYRPHGGFHGGYHGGWHGGYGGWRGGGWGYGGWGWGAPLAFGALAAGAAIAATSPYYYGGPYNGDPCYRLTPMYNQWGAYVGRQWSYVCR